MITWGYVAGFMDGEGTVRAQYVRLYQKHPLVLEQISEFLNSNGIRAYVRCRKTPRVTNLLVINQESFLQVNMRVHIKALLEMVMPYLIVKKAEAQDVLRFYKMFPERSAQEAGMLGRERSSSAFGRGSNYKVSRHRLNGRFVSAAIGG